MTTPTPAPTAPAPAHALLDAPAHAHDRRCFWDLAQARWSCAAPTAPGRPAGHR